MNSFVRNNVRISGRGEKTILFSHGYGCSQEMWSQVAPAFEEQYQVVLYDLIGSGGSDTSAYNLTRYSTLQGYADDLVHLCRELDLSEVIFVGHSVSSMIGMLAAIQAPELFERLIMIGPSPCYIDDETFTGGFSHQAIQDLLQALQSNFTNWANAIAPLVMGRKDRPELGVRLAESFCSQKPEIAKHFAQVTFLSDNRHDLAKLRVPSLILQCSDDVIAPVAVGRYLHQHLAGSEFVQLRAVGHCPHLSAPEETVKEIRAYLDRISRHEKNKPAA